MSTATKSVSLDAIFKGLGDFFAMLAYWLLPRRTKVQKRVGAAIREEKVKWPEILNAPELPEVSPEVPPPPIAAQIEAKVVAMGEHVDLQAAQEILRPEQLVRVDREPLSDMMIEEYAGRLQVPAVHMRAVFRVECPTRKGFDPATDLPIILFEYHKFSEFTSGRFDESHPHLSNPKWKAIPYPRDQATRWKHLREAWELDPVAAFKAASYGLFQTMGFVFRECGCASLMEYMRRVARSERDQVELFVGYVLSKKLVEALRKGDWYEFARYNTGNGTSRKALEQRQKYAGMLERAFESEAALERAKADAAAGRPARVIPNHTARCARTVNSSAIPLPACTCGADGSSTEVSA